LRECPLILAEEAAAKGALLQRVEDGVPIGLREAQYGPSEPTSTGYWQVMAGGAAESGFVQRTCSLLG
jgi:hypothetical protein